MHDSLPTAPPRKASGTARLVLFASGDFACNLYWQSLSFFLLFFYTDVLRLPPALAGTILTIGAVVDGIANLTVGYWAERLGRYRDLVRVGAFPLGLCFIFLFVVPSPELGGRVAIVIGAHVAFRACYAAVNIPYVALAAQITRSSRARAGIAAGRMLFGTAAALTVALVMRALSRAPDGRLTDAGGYLLGAAGFAIVGTAILFLVTAGAPDGSRAAVPARRGNWSELRAILANRAFVTLVLASAAVTVGGGVLNGSVIYYFSYVVGKPSAGAVAVGWMGVAGALAIPLWLLVRDRLGTRAMWLVDVAGALLILAAFAGLGGRSVVAGVSFFVAMQVAMVGFSFAFAAMLPDTIEWGEHWSAVRVEALAFGVAALAQRLALGLSTLLLGIVYQRAGYAAGAAQTPGVVIVIRLVALAGPSVGLALSAIAIAANPLRRGTHERLVAALDTRTRHAADSERA